MVVFYALMKYLLRIKAKILDWEGRIGVKSNYSAWKYFASDCKKLSRDGSVPGGRDYYVRGVSFLSDNYRVKDRIIYRAFFAFFPKFPHLRPDDHQPHIFLFSPNPSRGYWLASCVSSYPPFLLAEESLFISTIAAYADISALLGRAYFFTAKAPRSR